MFSTIALVWGLFFWSPDADPPRLVLVHFEQGDDCVQQRQVLAAAGVTSSHCVTTRWLTAYHGPGPDGAMVPLQVWLNPHWGELVAIQNSEAPP